MEDDADAAAVGPPHGVLHSTATSSEDQLMSWKVLQERITSPPSLLQLSRRAIRRTIVANRGRRELTAAIEGFDRDVLPKMLKDYVAMVL